MRTLTMDECEDIHGGSGGEPATRVDDIVVTAQRKVDGGNQNVFFGSYTTGAFYGEVGVGGRDVYVGGGVGVGRGLGVSMEQQEDVSTGVNVTPTSAGFRTGIGESYQFLRDGARDMLNDFVRDRGLDQIPSLQNIQR